MDPYDSPYGKAMSLNIADSVTISFTVTKTLIEL